MKRAVFGTGIALENHWELINHYFQPEICLDNNPNKWNKVDPISGLMCRSPECLLSEDGAEILIAVGDPYAVAAITDQLTPLKVNIKSLMVCLNEWTKDLDFNDNIKELIQTSKRRIILFNTPNHNNLGDYLITAAEKMFIEQYFPEYDLFLVSDIEFLWYGNRLKSHIGDDDIILIAGGGFLGSLWLYNGELNVRSIIEDYPNNRIIILPQTMYFEKNLRGEAELKKTISSYRTHNRLSLCLREEASYALAKKIFPENGNIFVLPDMALYYDLSDYGIKIDDYHDNQALIVLRSDKESVLNIKDKTNIEKVLIDRDYDVIHSSMREDAFDSSLAYERLSYKLKEISSSGLVVTDTLHCMVSAAISGTPCIFFDNLSGKLSNVYQWIYDLPYVSYCRAVSEFSEKLDSLSMERGIYHLRHREKYMEKLNQIIRGLYE